MTQEDKELLLKDICARLPYGLKCVNVNWPKDGSVQVSNIRTREWKIQIFEDWVDIEYCKPYLRPMSSMTKEERKYRLTSFFQVVRTDNIGLVPTLSGPKSFEYIDWLNAHHFDYNGLIEKGLALEAPEGMYKTE